MQVATIYIALGSNIEPRAERLSQARSLLQLLSLGEWKESSIYETEPLGPSGQGKYLNQVVSFLSNKSAIQLLHFCKGAELWLGRKARGHWMSREIDLDLLYRGHELIDNKYINLPHLQISQRKFVLEPLSELNSLWIDARTQLSVQTMLMQVSQVEKL